jgi:hypothetical protein
MKMRWKIGRKPAFDQGPRLTRALSSRRSASQAGDAQSLAHTLFVVGRLQHACCRRVAGVHVMRATNGCTDETCAMQHRRSLSRVHRRHPWCSIHKGRACWLRTVVQNRSRDGWSPGYNTEVTLPPDQNGLLFTAIYPKARLLCILRYFSSLQNETSISPAGDVY